MKTTSKFTSLIKVENVDNTNYFLEFDSGRGFSSVSAHPYQHTHSSPAKYQAPMKSYHSPPDTYGHASAPSSDAYGAPESPVSSSQPQYSGHYTYDDNLTPSSQINYFDTKK